MHEGYHRKQCWRPSAAQRRILDGVRAGESNAAIAARLALSAGTVKWHVSQLLAETGCDDREALGRWWAAQPQCGWLALPFLIGAHLAVACAVCGVLLLGAGTALMALRASSHPASTAPSDTSGCGDTPQRVGTVPTWIDTASGHNVPHDLPFVVASNDTAAGFCLAPLRAADAQNFVNKVIWVVRTPRDGAPLQVALHPRSAVTPAVELSQTANSGPGNIYPMLIDVPTPGCWHVTLRWATGQAELDLRYVAPPAATPTP